MQGFGNARLRLEEKHYSKACDLWSMVGDPQGHGGGTWQRVPTEPFTPFALVGSSTSKVLILKQDIVNKLNKRNFHSFHNHIFKCCQAGWTSWQDSHPAVVQALSIVLCLLSSQASACLQCLFLPLYLLSMFPEHQFLPVTFLLIPIIRDQMLQVQTKDSPTGISESEIQPFSYFQTSSLFKDVC